MISRIGAQDHREEHQERGHQQRQDQPTNRRQMLPMVGVCPSAT